MIQDSKHLEFHQVADICKTLETEDPWKLSLYIQLHERRV